MNRIGFLGASAALSAVAGARSAAAPEPPGAFTPGPHRRRFQFFSDPGINFVFLTVLGAAYYGAGDVGTALALADQIDDGDRASAFAVFSARGESAHAAADAAAARGHKVTAREQYLAASSYTFAATYFADAAGKADRMFPLWSRSREALEAAFSLFASPVERIAIPYENTTLSGYIFKVDESRARRPLLILCNGSDGSVLDMWVQGGAAGVARGYNCLTFDGPGQGAALWLQHLAFRPDWEHVVTPVVDFALRRQDVDSKRVAIQGVSQGGYWVPRAVAFEHRIAAAVADPGVVDVSESWLSVLPAPMLHLLKSGQKRAFDRSMSASGNAAQRATLEFRARPYGITSPFDLYMEVQNYSLDGIIQNIRCPMLITDPEGEQFWPGQSQRLYDALQTQKALAHFTAAEGANLHCEPMAPGLRAQRIFDWFDETLR